MESFAKMLAVARAEVSGHLDPHERVVAMGRCADITELFDIEQAGTARTLVVITNTKLRWVPGYNLDYEASLDLDRVTSFTERSHGHRFAIWMGIWSWSGVAYCRTCPCLPISVIDCAAKDACGRAAVRSCSRSLRSVEPILPLRKRCVNRSFRGCHRDISEPSCTTGGCGEGDASR
jgi:hypothetical protein